jgi:Glucodextranase, domain B
VAVAAALAVAVAGCGSTTTTTTTTTSAAGSGAVTIVVTSPTSGSVIAAENVTIRGTVNPPNAVVQIQGQPAAVGNGVFTGTATLHGGKTTIDVVGSAPGATPGATSVTLTRQSSGGSGGSSQQPAGSPTPAVAQQAPASVNPAPASVNPAPASSNVSHSPCGGGLVVGSYTTCEFAENVRAAYDSHGPGTVEAFSPATGKTYSMTCTAGTPVECTGGNNASVYFP